MKLLVKGACHPVLFTVFEFLPNVSFNRTGPNQVAEKVAARISENFNEAVMIIVSSQ